MNLKEKVFVDWCRFVFDVRTDEEAVSEALDFVAEVFGEFDLVPAPCKGQLNYAHGVSYIYGEDKHATKCAHLFYGGDYTNGTACIDINGSGCSLVSIRDAWHLVHAFLEQSGAKLTRVDTALDFPDGELTMAQAKRAYLRDEFKNAKVGRGPKADCRGDWIGHYGAGRTLMVGKREHGKQARVYEKGKQLGNPESGWVRFEIEWLSKDRVLPYDMVTRPEGYFAGGYPVCARLLKVGGERIKTLRREWLYGVDVGRRNLRTQYGQMLFQLRSTYSSAEEMVNDLERPGCPKRLEKGALIESAQPVLAIQEIKDGERSVVDNPAWHL